ncbi:basic amino acid ABC transporter substrate-binding protein [Campylobacter hyointestinalis]|uniref:Basic amino acid ABC transporter substrate-binding protein n=1 Tax=Campylobacter hyointestinalis subsp. lawsonii TaxID=91353 RepID=A0AAV6EG04_CAMHY|nr:basic amino acid ABC transporter substrate-binding protein [Campylobacter hyointestinalis]KAB0613132.1 basic amino acid ABC transporter substrate-binding protein [Campylobacter hyointestinalis subsp. lawsonii]QKF69278.1 amino acid ABC transporter, periplasmic arginine/lysine/histidine-binding protein [Campylobacter hyointestinalis subsp. lawsonii]RAZ27501.1 basic amino acid ABC transporter substrate-binding protein [Campylobacter hyointestinalis subsp. lawsonii]
MKSFFKFIVAACVAAGFSHAADVLKVGTNAAYPPFEFIDEQNKIAGFDMDLIDALSKKVGFEYKIVNMSFDGLIPALKAGKIDAVAAAMSATPERIKAVSFTKPYYTTENLFIKQAKNGDLTSKQNLEGKKIAVQLGTVQEIAARTIKGVKVMANEDIFAAIMALKNGKVDAVLVDSSIGYGYLNKNKDLAEFLKEPDGSEGFSIAFDKDKHTDLIAKINQAVEELKNDGTYDKLLEKYNLK